MERSGTLMLMDAPSLGNLMTRRGAPRLAGASSPRIASDIESQTYDNDERMSDTGKSWPGCGEPAPSGGAGSTAWDQTVEPKYVNCGQGAVTPALVTRGGPCVVPLVATRKRAQAIPDNFPSVVSVHNGISS